MLFKRSQIIKWSNSSVKRKLKRLIKIKGHIKRLRTNSELKKKDKDQVKIKCRLSLTEHKPIWRVKSLKSSKS